MLINKNNKKLNNWCGGKKILLLSIITLLVGAGIFYLAKIDVSAEVFCGGWEYGGYCWYAAADNQTCTDACNAEAAECSPAGLDDYNDDSTCTIQYHFFTCSAGCIGYTPETGVSLFAPVRRNTDTCYYSNGESSVDCDRAPGTGFRRLCPCVQLYYPPTVSTDLATVDIQNDQATLKGNITDTGGENPSQRVLEWGTTSGNYTNSYNCGSGGTGEFSHTISINSGTIYYYRAKAYNSGGWGYGTERQVVIYTAPPGGQQQFTTLPITYTLTIFKAGTGSGIVTDTGINCGTNCSELYDFGTTVTLTAYPDPDSEFAGWSGCDIVGDDTCVVTMTSDKDVTATFDLSDTTPPTTEIRIIRTSDDEDVTDTWLKADTYNIQFIDEDPEPNPSGLQSCEYYINFCDPDGLNCNTSVVLLTPRDCNSLIEITPGPADSLFNLEADEGMYRITSGVTDNADNSGWKSQYMWFDFTSPIVNINFPLVHSWQNSNFTLQYDAADENINICKLYTKSAGDASFIYRKNITCGINQTVEITVGSGQYCYNQGYDRCEIKIWADDTCGNEKDTTRFFSIDWEPPTTEVGP